MNQITKLIKELCPNGVEFRKLGDICEFKRGTSITKKDLISGEIPVIAGGQKPAYYHNTANRTGETIAISGSGAYSGFVSYWKTPVFLSDSFSVKPIDEELLLKYLFYFLKSKQDKIFNLKSKGGIPHVYGKDVAKLKIPLPPIQIQKEIIDILDKFTELDVMLGLELNERKSQYEYYREKLFDIKNVESKTFGEIGSFLRGRRFVKDDMIKEGVPCIHYGEMYTYYNIYTDKTKAFLDSELAKKLRVAHAGDVVIVAAGETVEDIGQGVAWFGNSDVVVHDACYIFSHNLNPKYVSYFLRTRQFHSQIKRFISSGKISSINSNGLEKAKIPIPSKKEQERIVAILDNFNALVNDNSIGLPAEIAARKKQYEYYREKLLTFKEKEVVA